MVDAVVRMAKEIVDDRKVVKKKGNNVGRNKLDILCSKCYDISY